MTEIDVAIKKAVNVIATCLKTHSPETDISLLPEKVKELVYHSLANDTCSSVEILASDSMPEFNLAADALAAAHSMYKAGDRENGLKMVIYAFNSPDCAPLMKGILSLNEEAVAITASVNKNLGDFSDIQNGDPDSDDAGGDDDSYASGLDHMGVEDIIESPSIRDQEHLESDLTDAGSRAPYSDTAEEDDEIEGVPPGDVTVMASPKRTDKLLFLAAKRFVSLADATDAVPGFDDNMQSDAYNDPAIDPDINLDNTDPEFEQATQLTPLDFNFEEAVENVGSGSFSDMDGIDKTIQGDPVSPGDYNERADSPGDSAQLDPEYALIAKIADPSVKAAATLLLNKGTRESKKKLRAFITYNRNVSKAA